jgi:hypothetical protein
MLGSGMDRCGGVAGICRRDVDSCGSIVDECGRGIGRCGIRTPLPLCGISPDLDLSLRVIPLCPV